MELGMAIKSEVFSGYFEEIDASLEIRIEGLGFSTHEESGVYQLVLKRPK